VADCEEKKVILEKIDSIIDRLNKTEDKTDINTTDIQNLKQSNVSTDEKFTRVFELLCELKEGMTDIRKAIEMKNERLPTLIYTVGGIVLGGSISGVIVFILTK